MATLQDYRNERLRKLETLRELGVDPYPARSERTHGCGEVLAHYDELAGREVVVAGRIASIRSFGKLAFIKLRDQSGDVQLYLQRDDVAELDAGRGVLGMKQLKLLDTGDFVEARGVMTTTQTGEKSVGVRELRLLTKSLRPMPEKLENKEERFQPIIAGSELGNGFSELNDPIDQLNRFVEQQRMRDAGDEEAMMLDIDFVEMLEYGMPPACGWGYSERVFWIFEGVTAREGVPFPQLRSEIDETTRAIYPEVKL